MTATQIFVGLFAVVSASVSGFAIWRILRTHHLGYKPLWILGSLFGFAGFATNWTIPGDLFLEVEIQIPVVLILTLPGGDTILKTLFPLGAVAALVTWRSSAARPKA